MDTNTERRFELKKYPLREVARRMWPLVRPHRWRLLTACILVSICGAAAASMPMFTKYVIDTAILEEKSVSLAGLAMGIFLVLQLGRIGLFYIAQTIITSDQEAIVFRLRSESFRRLQRLCLRFHGKYPSGWLHDRVFIQCVQRIGMLITYVFQHMALQVAMFFFALVMCLYLNVAMTGVILVGAVAYVLVARAMGPRMREQAIECSESHNRVCGYIMDKLQGNKTIQAFALEDHVEKEFDKEIWATQQRYIRAAVQQHRMVLVTQALSFTLTAAIYVLGAYMILGPKLASVGMLVAFAGYQGQLINIISQFTAMYGQIAAARTGFDQLYTVMDTQSTVPDDAAPKEMPRLVGEIEFRNVTFSYEDEPVLNDASFKIEPGQTVALVGRSGAGKSTITNLLLRFYDPDSGQILVDGRNIRNLPLRPYRSRFGVVLQEPFLFDDTILNNLRCVKPGATDKEIRRALEQARALEFVEAFPEGLKHRVGERGGQLSGGQRQRIAIARAMLLSPDVLVLDEATAALDNESEALIQQALESLFEHRTAFVIAHRLSTIRHVDRVLVFDAGRLVEGGTFDELLARKGLFRYLHDVASSTSTQKFKLDEAGFA